MTSCWVICKSLRAVLDHGKSGRLLPVQRGHFVHRTNRSPCEAGYNVAAITTSARPLFFFFMQAVIGVDPGILILENNLTTKFAHIFSWIVAPGFVQNAADSQRLFDVLTYRQVFFSPAVLSFL